MNCFHQERTAGGGPGPKALARVSLGVALLLFGGASILPAQDTTPEATPPAPGFQVIVHADLTVARLPAKTVAKMFQKKTRRWETGEPVVPVDLGSKHPVRKTFSRAVHNRSVTAVVSYWQRIIFSKGGSPPESKESEAEVLAFVAATPGAIGYVSDDADLGDGVKPLTLDGLKGNP